MRTIIECVLYVVGLFGFVMGVVTVALLAPSQQPVEGGSAASSGLKTLVALHAAVPAFTLGAVALGLAGVMTALGRPAQR